MKLKTMLKAYQIVLGFFLVLFAVFLYWLNACYLEPFSFYSSGNLRYEKARVLEITDSYLEKSEDTNSGFKGKQQLQMRISSGDNKGAVIEVENHLTKTHNIYAKQGDLLIICLDQTSQGFHASVYNYSRSHTIYFMIGFYILLMIAVGKTKGFQSAVGLSFSFICILYFTLPLIFHGWSPIIITVISIVLITTVSLILIDGLTKKVLVALLSTSAGVIAAGILFTLFSKLLEVSGFNLDDAEAIYLITQNTGLQLRHILFAGLLISALGAVMDVAMSIASTLNELHERNPELSTRELYYSGINVGKDMIGTMSNTLILAYTGSSFSTMILFKAYCISYQQLINMDYLVIEIAQALAGSMGIVITVPFAALIGSNLLHMTLFKKK